MIKRENALLSLCDKMREEKPYIKITLLFCDLNMIKRNYHSPIKWLKQSITRAMSISIFIGFNANFLTGKIYLF